jgi:putative endonuclease
MYYIYVLQSLSENQFYTGYTSDLRVRLIQHQKGEVQSTKSRLPLKFVYFEGCLTQKDATKSEKYLKSTYGKSYIKNRIEGYLSDYSTG